MLLRIIVLMVVITSNPVFSSVSCDSEIGDHGLCNISYIKSLSRNADYIKDTISGSDLKLLKNTYIMDYVDFNSMISNFYSRFREVIYFHGERSDYDNEKYTELNIAVEKYSNLSFSVTKLLYINNINLINFATAAIEGCPDYNEVRSYWISVSDNYERITIENDLASQHLDKIISREKWAAHFVKDPVDLSSDKERSCLTVVLSFGPYVEGFDKSLNNPK